MAPLSQHLRERAMRLSLFEGVFFAFMVGSGESYFIADAVRLRASPLEIGLLVSLPLCIGGMGPLVTLAALHRLRRRKVWTVAAVLAQAMVLLTVSLLDISGRLVPRLLILAVCLYQMAGLAAGTAWTSWYGDLVPAERRGSYFARRNRGVQLATFAGLISSGLLLQLLEPGAAGDVSAGKGGLGFQLIFAIAALSRLASGYLMAISPEPAFRGLSRPGQVFRFLGTDRGQSAWRLILLGASLYVATYMAAPYFAPFMLQGLRFSYTEYMIATLCSVAAKLMMLPTWGRAIDRNGARPVYLLAAVLIALVPLPWLWVPNLWWVAPVQFFSGISWSGYETSYFAVMLQSSFKRTRVHVFAAQSVFNGTAQLVGGMLGAFLLTRAQGGYGWIFASSFVLRLLVAMSIPALLPKEGTDQPGRREMVLRIAGLRPHGGVVHRPIPEPDDEDVPGETRRAG